MLYFSDYFQVQQELLDEYGAFNISLINNLPLVIDPFLLFASEKAECQKLHKDILKYLDFLKTKSEAGNASEADIKSWCNLPRLKQTMLGSGAAGNNGNGTGKSPGELLFENLNLVFDDLNNERVTISSHPEKAELLQIGIGREYISDFVSNLIKEFLIKYTEEFAVKNLLSNQVKNLTVHKAYFDYKLGRWMPRQFQLPFFNGDYVLLTPKDILVQEDYWINRKDLLARFKTVINSISDEQLKAEVLKYYKSKSPVSKKKKAVSQEALSLAIEETLQKFPYEAFGILLFHLQIIKRDR